MVCANRIISELVVLLLELTATWMSSLIKRNIENSKAVGKLETEAAAISLALKAQRDFWVDCFALSK